MQIRPATTEDLDALLEIDGTIESTRYLFVEQSADEQMIHFKLQERALREPAIQSNRLNDETNFLVRQIVAGTQEGYALVADHDAQAVATMVATPRYERQVLELVDLRVDYDFRRQGLGLALLYQLISIARESPDDLRAITASTRTGNWPAISLLKKCGFTLSGLDTRFLSNHDLVKEEVTLFWYLPLEQ